MALKQEAWLKEHQTIRIGCTPDFAPIEFLDTDGSFKGIFADYVRLISSRLGIDIVPVFLPWSDILSQAQERRIDMFYGQETPERKSYMAFSNKLIKLFISNSSRPKFERFFNLVTLIICNIATFW